MRTVLMLSTAVLMLTSASVARAQEGVVNLGYRGSSITGDEARWERYRDLRAGPVGSATYINDNGEAALSFTAANVGYHDQSYEAAYNRFGKVRLTALWNSIPLNYAYNTLTPWVDQGSNVWTLDQATRTAVQNKTPGVLGIGTNASHYDLASVYRSLATPFEMQSRRDILKLGLNYQLNEAFNLDLGFNTTKRGGNQPYGMAFAFNNGNELPMTIDDRNNDITAALEWVKPGGSMLRVQWLGSWYKNEFLSLTWDNPLRATDFSNGKTPPAGPYDASGYSNGNGPATGRIALAPSNNMNSFSLVGLHKLPGRSTLSGTVSFATMKQDEDLIPWTTNANIANSAVYALFPGLASLPRSSAEAEVRAVNAQLNFTTRPTDELTLNLRYRFNDRDNRTPEFDASNNVRFDAVPEDVPGTHTRHYNVRRSTFETGATLNLIANSALGIGYIFEDVKREGRVFAGMTDYTFRVSLDTYGNQYFSVRSVFERTNRLGSGLSEHELEHGGSQLGARFFDEAELGRNKGTLQVQITPNDKFDVGLSVSTIKDDYNGEEHEFGLLDNSNTSYNATFTVYPAQQVTLSGNYGYDKYNALQESRNANPLSTVPGAYQSWDDVNRNWSLDNEEIVKSYGLSVDLLKALPNTDIRLSYDRSESDNAFVYGGPRIQELMTNTALTPGDGSPCGAGLTSCFSQLPNVTNDWQQFRVNVTRTFGKNFGAGLGYSYEKFDVVDFATRNLADGSPRIDPLGTLSTGYGNRPYKGSLFTAQLSYRFQPAGMIF